MTNAEIKMLRSLRDKKFRDEFGVFIVEGEKMVQEALASDFNVRNVWRRDEVGDAVMDRISALMTPSPVMALVEMPQRQAPRKLSGLCLALDSVRDPGNIGTILRLADWFGVDAVFTSRDCADIFNPKVVQSTMGAIFRVPVFDADIPELCRQAKRDGLGVFGTFLDGDDIYAQALPGSGLVIMGNESVGVSAAVAAEVNARLLIPSFAKGPTAESLNVATATAVVLSEFKRRSR